MQKYKEIQWRIAEKIHDERTDTRTKEQTGLKTMVSFDNVGGLKNICMFEQFLPFSKLNENPVVIKNYNFMISYCETN